MPRSRKRSQQLDRAGKQREVLRAIGVVTLGTTLRDLGSSTPTLSSASATCSREARELHLQIARREAMPEALGLGDVRGLERERIDAVLGGDLACHLFGGA